MEKFIYFIGVDISKKTLDFSVVEMGQQLFHLKTANDEKGIGCFLKKLKDLPQFEINQALFCMEYMDPNARLSAGLAFIIILFFRL